MAWPQSYQNYSDHLVGYRGTSEMGRGPSGRGGHVIVVQVVWLLVASFCGQWLLFSLVRHSKWMLRDTWALVWVRNGQTFQSKWRWAECVTLSFLEAFPHFGCRFLGGTTLFVLLFPRTDGKMTPIAVVPLNAPGPAPSQETQQPPLCVIWTTHLPYIIICLRWVCSQV